MGDGGSNLGAKLGDRLADVLVRAYLSTHQRLGPEKVKLGMAWQEDFFRLTGGEVNGTIGPLWAMIANDPDAAPWLRDTARMLSAGHGQWKTILAGATTGAALGGGLMDLITNELTFPIGKIIQTNPNMRLATPDLAQAAVRGLRSDVDYVEEAAKNGTNADRFSVLKQLSTLVPGLTEILEMLNRGHITDADADALFKRAGYSREHVPMLKTLRYTLVSLPDAAAMWNRDIVTTEQGRQLAVQQGYAADDFDRYAALGGAPPDTTSLILAWQRGVIDEARVDRALIQGPLRKEWIDVIKQLRYAPLPPTELADAVNQGHMEFGAAQAVATQSGVRPQDFQVIVDNAGIPPGPQEALDWVNRGLITDEEFRTAFLESRIKNKYIDLYLASRRTILTMAEIRSLYAKGVMTREQAIDRLLQRGYSTEDAAIILAGAIAEKTGADRDLTKAEWVGLYQDQLIDRQALNAALLAFGYAQDEADQLIGLADARRTRRFWEAALTRIRSQFVSHHIDANEATGAIDALSIPPDARDMYLALWSIERGVVTKELTTAQVVAAAKNGLLSLPDAQGRLEGMGYDPDDAMILLTLGKVPGTSLAQ